MKTIALIEAEGLGMTDHVHEWGIGNDDARIRCGCGKLASIGYITARLNATERLSAEDAMTLFTSSVSDWLSIMDVWGRLKAYADILEGK